jgi:hypothetical protein
MVRALLVKADRIRPVAPVHPTRPPVACGSGR